MEENTHGSSQLWGHAHVNKLMEQMQEVLWLHSSVHSLGKCGVLVTLE